MSDDFSFAGIIENSNDIVVVTRADRIDAPDPIIVYVNEAFTRLTGYTRAEVVGQSPRLLQGPGTDPAARAKIRAALCAQQPVRVEILNYSKSGRAYWLDLQIVPLRDASGRVTHFAAIERDLTERRQAEEALRERELQLRSVISAMGEGLVVQDRTGFITACNEAAERILGLTRDQIMGRTSIDPRWMAIRADGSPFPGAEHPAMQTLRDGRPYDQVLMGIRKPDESVTWIAVNTRPVFLTGEALPDAVVASFHDISEQRRADELKSEFISTVSHELRTPLTSIRGALGLLQGLGAANGSAQVAELITVAVRNSERLTVLINDLLDMEKIASGKMQLEMRAVDLAHVVEAALVANEPYAAKYGVLFDYAATEPGTTVWGEESRLLQVLANLLSNAAKHTPAGSRVRVALERPESGWVRVSVSDHGPGIPAGFRARVFERFAQAESGDARSRGGTGLGLAISKALIEKHGGRIGFCDNRPRGTTFYFDLPQCESARAA